MSNSKIAVGMIVLGTGKDPQNLRRCLKSIAPYIDGIYVTLTGTKKEIKETEKVCKEFKANISYYCPEWIATKEANKWLTNYLGYEPYSKPGDKIFLFDEARNFNFSQVPKDFEWIFWIDTDDVLINGENLWKLKEIGDQTDVDAFVLNYIYRATLDEKGNIKDVLIEHLKERVLRNGVFKWVAPIHETLVGLRPTTKTVVDDCKVLHLIDSFHVRESLVRNLKNLELAVYKTKGRDPRQIYNLAKAYIDLRTKEYNEKAIPLIQKFIWGYYRSEWPEERAQALEYLADIYRQKGQLNSAIKSCILALDEEPQRKSIYLNIASAYIDKKEWNKALLWVKLADLTVDKPTSLNVNPRDLQVLKLVAIYTASLNKGKTYDAHNASSQLIKLLPNDPAVKVAYDFIKQQKEQRDIAMTLSELVNHLRSTGEKEKIWTLLGNLPTIVANDPLVEKLKKEFFI